MKSLQNRSSQLYIYKPPGDRRLRLLPETISLSSDLMNDHLLYQTAVDPQRGTIGRLQYLNWGEFTGCVDITCETGLAWEFAFDRGQIVWGFDLSQPNRLWQRLLGDRFSLEALYAAAQRSPWAGFASGRQICWQYQGAVALFKRSAITAADLQMMLATAVKEAIFDLLQYGQGHQLSFRSQSESFLVRPPLSIETESTIERAEVMWQEWQAQKLDNVSPAKIPHIKHPVQLYRQTTPIIYQNLVRVITGKQTLREIALAIDEDLLLLTRSLVRYIQTGIIELVDLPDLPDPNLEAKPVAKPFPASDLAVRTLAQRSQSPAAPADPPPPATKLIFCIDDSPQITEIMRAIVTEMGYRFIAVQDPTQALARLLEHQPDLIFLDLMMPKINGYELCGQIRRISLLSQVPIVILTGKDGLIDRVRSKVIGASDFISKPIVQSDIDRCINRYLRATNSGA